jgi:methionyl aminopeptidase
MTLDNTLEIEAETRTGQIKIHKSEDFEGMRKAGKLAAECLDMLIPHVKFRASRRTSWTGWPASSSSTTTPCPPACIIAAIPRRSASRATTSSATASRATGRCAKGDIANIDVTVIVDGWHGDTSRMYGVGEVGPRARRLVEITYEGMKRGLDAVKPGATLGDIGHAIQSYVEAQRCSVVRDFCGHGLGKVFHDAPNILHFGRPGQGAVLKPGMFFTVEPMVNLGKPAVKVLNDGWTAVTRDKSLSAQCEHSIGVTEDGYEVFTASPTGLFQPPILGA